MNIYLKVLIGIVVLVLVGGGIWVAKNLTDKPAEVAQKPQANLPPQSERLASGDFMDADSLHHATGRVDVVESASGPIAVFKDFSVTQGPDLFVYLSPNPPGQDLGNFISLGELKANSGAQSYNLPANWRDYRTIIIWCRAFSTDFAYAGIK